MNLGVFIGSFNPVHKGHIHLVNYLLENNIVNKILIVPTGNYWDKQDLVDIKHRINMLKFYENERIIIDIENNSYPYTYLLMRKLKKDYPNDTLYLIFSADNIINFDKWKEYQELLTYNIIVMNRDNIDIDEEIKRFPNGNFITFKDFIPINISSSELREKLDEKYLDEKVLRYIKSNNLYGNYKKR